MNRTTTKRAFTAIIATIVLLTGLALFAWSAHRTTATAAEGAQDAPPPMPVAVTVIEEKPVQLWRTYSGRLTAVDFVELRPQVDGRIDEIRFEDGAHVEKGQVLFVIDPRPYEATAAEANAALAAAKSRQEFAIKELKRAEDLIKTQTIPQRVLDERRNAAKVAKNEVEAAQALVEKRKSISTTPI